MKLTKSHVRGVNEMGARWHRALLGGLATVRHLTAVLGVFAGLNPCFAGYSVDSHVESAGGTNYYSWAVYNEDQSWGLGGFAVQVPVQTRVLASTVPAPHANPDHTAYWVMQERHEACVDPHDGRMSIPAPRPGMKWLWWWGMESPSLYPPGTTVTFSVATDGSAVPGAMVASAVTYTPQNNPHYYLSWQGQVIGPSSIAEAAPMSQGETAPARALPSFRTSLVTNLEDSITGGSATSGTLLPVTSIALHVAVTVEGEIGRPCGIQLSTNAGGTIYWRGVANVLLSTPKKVWYDPEPATNPQRYYRVVPGPISIP